MQKFLKKIAIYSGVAFVIFNLIAWCALFFLGRSQFYKPQFISNGLKQTNYDYVVLGSSTGLTTLDTRQIDSITGLDGVNISMDDTYASSHYLIAQHFFAEGNTTKTLVLSILPWDAENVAPTMGKNDYRFLPYGNREYVAQHFSSLETGYFKPLTLSRFFPIAGVATYNTEIFYPSVVAALKPKYHNRFDGTGNYSYPQSPGIVFKPLTTETVVSIRNPYLRKIEALCQEKGVRLIYYLSPNTISNYRLENHQTFVNHSNLLTDGTLFYDGIHVNSTGRKICSAAFAQVLKTE